MNIILTAAGISWMTAQVVKVLFGLARYGRRDTSRILWRIIWAGGMPSAHSALVSSTAITIFLSSGAQSTLFGLSLIMLCIVMYDRSRMHSIYNTFQNKYPALKEDVQKDPVLKDLVGHSLPEIVMGALICLCAGYVTFLYI